jgi:hypothetical protein
VRRSVLLLAVCTVLLFLVIVAQGDLRRRQRSLEGARWYASILTQRMGETGALPLNLELPDEHPPVVGRYTWLSRADARLLRATPHRVVAASSTPVPRILARDGCAVIVFDDGRFDVEWLPLDTFAQIKEAQEEALQQLKAGPGHQRRSVP